MKQNILYFILFLSIQFTFSQTSVSGGIFSDQIWTEENSPYIVTDDIVIFQGVKLEIEAGVELKFAADVSLEVRGTLLAEGTEIQPIIFTSNLIDHNEYGDWQGLAVKNLLGGSASFTYTEFHHASIVMTVDCCDSSTPVVFGNCLFKDNLAVLSGYTGGDMIVNNCSFVDNYSCVDSADKTISNSIFRNNIYGLYRTERISVYNSIFENNDTALYGGRGIVENCVIENNNIGVKAFFEGFRILSSEIKNNNVGIELGTYDGFTPEIKYNEICNNALYNIKNNNAATKDLTDNCWCTTVESEIESGIFDAYDDIDFGFINYSIYDDNCENITSEIIKDITLGIEGFDENLSIDDVKVFPNPFKEVLNIKSSVKKINTISIYSIDGNLVLNSFPVTNEKINLDFISDGMYFIEINFGEDTLVKKVLKK